MKIGILTFHCAHNYGAVLQAYALQEFLKSAGHDIEVIDYRPDYLVRPYAVFYWNPLEGLSLLRKLRRLGWNIYQNSLFPLKIKRRKGFIQFIEEKLNTRSLPRNEERLKYDALIVGSDQVWNPVLTRGFDPFFWGGFSNQGDLKRIAYAASASNGESLLKDHSDQVKSYLENFDGISVREERLKKFLDLYTDKDVEVVLDPTLLMDANFWNKEAAKTSAKGKYVLIYQMLGNAKVYEVADKIASEIGAKVIEITPSVGRRSFMPDVHSFATPQEFLGYFKNAEFVVTTSFHGTVFSIINRKAFYYVSNGNSAEDRAKGLLESMGLGKQFLSEFYDVKWPNINWSIVEDSLGRSRIQSMNFLVNSLK